MKNLLLLLLFSCISLFAFTQKKLSKPLDFSVKSYEMGFFQNVEVTQLLDLNNGNDSDLGSNSVFLPREEMFIFSLSDSILVHNHKGVGEGKIQFYKIVNYIGEYFESGIVIYEIECQSTATNESYVYTVMFNIETKERCLMLDVQCEEGNCSGTVFKISSTKPVQPLNLNPED